MAKETITTDPTTGGQKGVKLARYDLIPVGPLQLLAEHYGRGAEKYEGRNWERGYAWSKSYASLQRHANAFWNGEDIDPETGSPHLAAVAWHAFALLEWTLRRQHHCRDDRPHTAAGSRDAVVRLVEEPYAPTVERRSPLIGDGDCCVCPNCGCKSPESAPCPACGSAAKQAPDPKPKVARDDSSVTGMRQVTADTTLCARCHGVIPDDHARIISRRDGRQFGVFCASLCEEGVDYRPSCFGRKPVSSRVLQAEHGCMGCWHEKDCHAVTTSGQGRQTGTTFLE